MIERIKETKSGFFEKIKKKMINIQPDSSRKKGDNSTQ